MGIVKLDSRLIILLDLERVLFESESNILSTAAATEA